MADSLKKLDTKRPCAFQEYASNMLANRKYQKMSLAEKGAYHLLRLECWVNDSVPANIAALSEIIDASAEETEKILTAIKPLFEVKDDVMTCPLLDDYWQSLLEKRLKMSVGGAKGGKSTQSKIKQAVSPVNVEAKPPFSRPLATLKPLNLNYSKLKKPIRYEKDLAPNDFKENVNDSFVEEYELHDKNILNSKYIISDEPPF